MLNNYIWYSNIKNTANKCFLLIVNLRVLSSHRFLFFSTKYTQSSINLVLTGPPAIINFIYKGLRIGLIVYNLQTNYLLSSICQSSLYTLVEHCCHGFLHDKVICHHTLVGLLDAVISLNAVGSWPNIWKNA